MRRFATDALQVRSYTVFRLIHFLMQGSYNPWANSDICVPSPELLSFAMASSRLRHHRAGERTTPRSSCFAKSRMSSPPPIRESFTTTVSTHRALRRQPMPEEPFPARSRLAVFVILDVILLESVHPVGQSLGPMPMPSQRLPGALRRWRSRAAPRPMRSRGQNPARL